MAIRPSRTLRLAAALTLSGAVIVGSATPTSASMGCAGHSFSFEGTRLLNDGTSNAAGPFTIALPAGTYDIVLRSFDDHAGHPGQTEQTQEQWYFELDSGYRSPVSSDIPDDEDSAIDTFTNVTIGGATAITVRHLGEGGVNSVAPACVGFALTEIAAEPEIDAVIEIAGPPTRTDPVTVTDAPEIEVVVEQIEVATPQRGPAEDIAELALTGPAAATWAMAGSGAVLLAVGTALVADERRRTRKF